MADPVGYVLYTYQSLPTGLTCHAYVTSSQQAAETVGAAMAKEAVDAHQPVLGYMVLPAESLPV